MKHQRLKHQTPGTNPHGSSNHQALKPIEVLVGLKYVGSPIALPLVNERADDDGALRHPFDFEERTAQFGEAIVRFSKKIPHNPTNDCLIGQLVGCGTSIGANYCEADERLSKRIFAARSVAVLKKQKKRSISSA
jgi:hypothetical protein